MISEIRKGSSDAITWRLTEFEHEVELGDGRILDLKADFGVDQLKLEMATLNLHLSDLSRKTSVFLTWSGLSSLHCDTIDTIWPAEDGRIGLIGVRLLCVDSGSLRFEIELDWLRVTADCHNFTVSIREHPEAPARTTRPGR